MTKKPLSEGSKVKMVKLLEHDFVCDVLNKRLKDHYADFEKIIELDLEPYKRHIGITSAVFVVQYKIKYQSKTGRKKDTEIFVSAHSDGSRLGAYEKTKFLYENGFAKGKFRVTQPLFFLKEQKAFFYISSPGRSLFYFFTKNPKANIKPAMKLAVGWIKKLHKFDTSLDNFKWPYFKISTMVPMPKRFIPDFYASSQERGQLVEELVEEMKKQAKYYNKKNKPKLIYGDCHPENVIIKSLKTNDLEMIDFTDLALGDPMMDIGTFIQQFDFMGHNFLNRKKINNYKKFFIETYFNKGLNDIDIEYINRINLYQAWTALRTTLFLFYMKGVENPIDDLLEDVRQYLELAKENKRIINLS